MNPEEEEDKRSDDDDEAALMKARAFDEYKDGKHDTILTSSELYTLS